MDHILTRLQALYPHTHDLKQFLCDETFARKVGGVDALKRKEALLIVEDGHDAYVSLYLDHALHAADVNTPCFHAAVEGFSHLLFFLERMEEPHPTLSQLELEIQAEVDKYVLSTLYAELDPNPKWIMGLGVGFIEHRDALRMRSHEVRASLFDHALFMDDEVSTEGIRYREAVHIGSQLTDLLERIILKTDKHSFLKLLRQTKHLSPTDKLHAYR